MVYDAAPPTSVQSKVTGCGTFPPLAGLTSVGADGGPGGGAPPNLVTKVSPQKIVVSPAHVRSKAPAVVGKSAE
jgi:hypothetical protein